MVREKRFKMESSWWLDSYLEISYWLVQVIINENGQQPVVMVMLWSILATNTTQACH